MSTTLHILADRRHVIGCQLMVDYMQTTPTHYFLKFDGQAAYTETHPKSRELNSLFLRISPLKHIQSCSTMRHSPCRPSHYLT